MTTLSLAENSRTKLDYHALGMGEPEPFWQPEYEVSHDPLLSQTRAEREAEVGIQRTLVLPAVHVRDCGEGLEGVEPRLDGPGLAFLDDESDGQEMVSVGPLPDPCSRHHRRRRRQLATTMTPTTPTPSPTTPARHGGGVGQGQGRRRELAGGGGRAGANCRARAEGGTRGAVLINIACVPPLLPTLALTLALSSTQ